MIVLFLLPANASAAAPRAFELVTPPEKNSSEVTVATEYLSTPQASRDGNAVAYEANGPFPGSTSGARFQYISRRSATGWTLTSPLPLQRVQTGLNFQHYEWYSPDLSQGVVLSAGPALVDGAPDAFNNLYWRDFGIDASWRLLTPLTPNVWPAAFGSSYMPMIGAVADGGRHVVYEAPDRLFAEGAGFGANVYELRDGVVRPVGILPDGTIDPGGSALGAGTGWAIAWANSSNIAGAVSDDLATIFWTSRGDGQLYVRRDGTSTDLVSGSQAATPDPNGPQGATFQCGAHDGSRALFTSPSALTDDANTGRDGSGVATDTGANLYRYDVASRELKDLTVTTEPADAVTGAAVQGVVACSDDARTVYVVANGVLAAGGVAGKPNLYVIRDATVKFVATLDPADSDTWAARPAGRKAAVTADGMHLAFTSIATPTAYSNADQVTGAPDSEVYEYNAESQSLACASCRGDGSRPTGSSSVVLVSPFAMSRGLSDDGSRLFFDSGDAIVAGDTNGKGDVYVYEAGSAHLISSGRGSSDARLYDTTASGDDVFFTTRDPLVPEDQDRDVDLYDARVGGGFAHPASVPSCADDACQGQVTPPPASPPIGTQRFHGTGNARPGPASASFAVGRPSAAQRHRFGRTGLLRLRVITSVAGRITVEGHAAINGQMVIVAHGSTAFPRPGLRHVPVRLSSAARRTLKQRHRLSVRLVVRFSKAASSQRITLILHD